MAAPNVLKACRTAGGYLVRVEGQGTMQNSPALRDFARCLDEQQAISLAIDLARCEYLDSTFLGCIVGLFRRSQHEKQFSLTVYGPPETRRQLLGATRLDSLLHCADAAPAPTGEWVTLSAPQLEPQEFGRHIMECHHRLGELDCPAAGAFKAAADQLARELGEPRA